MLILGYLRARKLLGGGLISDSYVVSGASILGTAFSDDTELSLGTVTRS